MSDKNFYAVKLLQSTFKYKHHIFDDWDRTRKYLVGKNNANRGFVTIEEAINFLGVTPENIKFHFSHKENETLVNCVQKPNKETKRKKDTIPKKGNAKGSTNNEPNVSNKPMARVKSKKNMFITTSPENSILHRSCLENLDKIDDISPLIQEFCLSSAGIMLLGMGTGLGKGYGILRTLSEKYKYYNFVTDRNKVVKEHNDDSPFADKLLITSNVENIAKKSKELEAFARKHESLREMTSLLLEDIKDYNRVFSNKLYTQNDKEHYLNKLTERESQFRSALKKYVYNKHPEIKNMSIEERSTFFHKSKDLSLLYDIFPTMYFFEKTHRFTSLQKCFANIDTIFFGIYGIMDKAFSKDSLFFIDEADSDKEVILNALVKNATSNAVDLKSCIDIMKIVVSKIRSKNLLDYYYDNVLLNLTSDLERLIDELDNKYMIHSSFQFSDTKAKDRYFLYQRNDISFTKTKTITNNESKKEELVVVKGENGKLLVTFNGMVIDKDKILYKINDLFECLQSTFAKGIEVIRYMVGKEKQERRNNFPKSFINEKELAEDVLCLIAPFLTDNYKLKNVFVSLICETPHLNKTTSNTSYDFYKNGFDYFSLEMNGELSLSFKVRFLHNTPENILLTIIENGGKIVLSSATIGINGVYSNFALNYKELQKHIYVPTEKWKSLYYDYINARQSDIDDYIKNNLHFSSVNTNPKFSNGAYTFGFVDVMNNYVEKMLEKNNGIDFYYDIEVEREEISNFLSSLSETHKNERESSIYYYFALIESMFIAIMTTRINSNNSHLSLCAFNLFFNTNNSNARTFLRNDIATYFYNKIMTISAKLNDKIEIMATSTNNIDDVLNRFRYLMKEGYFVVIMSSYQTFMKGLSPTFEITKDLHKYIPINELGKKTLKEIKAGKSIIVDIDTMFLAKPTNLAPTIDQTNYDAYISSLLLLLYFIESSYTETRIDDGTRNLYIDKVTHTTKNSFDTSLRNLSFKDEIANMLRIIIQAFGRMMRSNFRHPNTQIFIDENIIETIRENSGLLEEIGINDDFLKQQSKGLVSFMNFLTSNSIEKKVDITNPASLVSINKARAIVRQALHLNFDKKDPTLYKEIVSNINKVIITEDDFQALPTNARDVYMENIDNSNGYVVEKGKYATGDNIIRDILPASQSKKDTPFSLNSIRDMCNYNNETIKHILKESNIDLENDIGKYILTPDAFRIMWGKIGEAILFHNLAKFLGEDKELHTLPDEIYEIADRYFEYKEIIVLVDAKFYVDEVALTREWTKSTFNNVDQNKKFMEKINKAHEYFGKPILLMIVNSKPNDAPKSVYKVNKYPQGMIERFDKKMVGFVTIPNILDKECNLRYDVLESAFSEINSLRLYNGLFG